MGSVHTHQEWSTANGQHITSMVNSTVTANQTSATSSTTLFSLFIQEDTGKHQQNLTMLILLVCLLVLSCFFFTCWRHFFGVIQRSHHGIINDSRNFQFYHTP